MGMEGLMKDRRGLTTPSEMTQSLHRGPSPKEVEMKGLALEMNLESQMKGAMLWLLHVQQFDGNADATTH